MVTFILWRGFEEESHHTKQAAFNERSTLLNAQIATHMNFIVIAIERMADRWDASDGIPIEEWESDALNYVKDFPAQTGMGLAGNDYIIKSIVPLETNKEAMGLYIAFNEERKIALELSRQLKQPTISPPIDLVQGGKGFIIYMPLHVGDRFDGFLTSIVRPNDFVKARLSDGFTKYFEFNLHDQEKVIYETEGYNNVTTDFSSVTSFPLLERNWTVELHGKPAFSKAHDTNSAEIALIGGLFFSILSGFFTFSFLTSLNQNELLKDKTHTLVKKEKEQDKLVESLAESNEELARFAYVCSHDLQEPLRMVRVFSQKLDIHLDDQIKDDPKGRRYFNFIQDGAERAQTLIQDILAYSQITNDDKHNDNIDLNEVINVSLTNLTPLINDNKGRITSDVLPIVRGNKTQIFQLLQNLISNGLKYQDGSTPPLVHVSATETQSHWEISVADNGIGIAPEYQDKIFNVFERLHRRQDYAGTGIGLSICKKVVKRHGGEIYVNSNKGEGSTFVFTLAKSMPSEEKTA